MANWHHLGMPSRVNCLARAVKTAAAMLSGPADFEKASFLSGTIYVQNIGLGFSAMSGGQGNFANVQLASLQAVPIPASLFLFGSGILGLTALGKMKL